jgi:hypothetical protein
MAGGNEAQLYSIDSSGTPIDTYGNAMSWVDPSQAIALLSNRILYGDSFNDKANIQNYLANIGIPQSQINSSLAPQMASDVGREVAFNANNSSMYDSNAVNNGVNYLQSIGISPNDINSQVTSSAQGFLNADNAARSLQQENSNPSGFIGAIDKVLPAVALGIATGGVGAALGGALGIGSASAAIGEGLLGAGATGASTVGSAVLSAGTNALVSLASGKPVDPTSLLVSAGTAGIGANSMDIASNILGNGDPIAGVSTISDIADATGQSTKQVANLITNAISTGIATSATNGGDPTKAILNNLASTEIGNFAGNIVNQIDPGNLNTAANIASSVAKVGATAALNNQDIGTALQNSLPQIIGSTASQAIKSTSQDALPDYTNDVPYSPDAASQPLPVDTSDVTVPQNIGLTGNEATDLNYFNANPTDTSYLNEYANTPTADTGTAQIGSGTSLSADAATNPLNPFYGVANPEIQANTGTVSNLVGGGDEYNLSSLDALANNPLLPISGEGIGGSEIGATGSIIGSGEGLGVQTLSDVLAPTGLNGLTPNDLQSQPTVIDSQPSTNVSGLDTSGSSTGSGGVSAPLSSISKKSSVSPLSGLQQTGLSSTPSTTPSTLSSTTSTPSSTSSGGNIPTPISGQSLAGAPVYNTNTQILQQLQQLDPSLLSKIAPQLSKQSKSSDLMQSGLSALTPSTQSTGSQQQSNPYASLLQTMLADKGGSNPTNSLLSSGLASLSGSAPGYKKGGRIEHHDSNYEHHPEFITGATGHYVKGRGDGQSDDIPAMLADGEYVFDADTVAALGNGSSDAGAKLLDHFRESLRAHKRSAPNDKIPPKASPLMYMKEALRKHNHGT